MPERTSNRVSRDELKDFANGKGYIDHSFPTILKGKYQLYWFQAVNPTVSELIRRLNEESHPEAAALASELSNHTDHSVEVREDKDNPNDPSAKRRDARMFKNNLNQGVATIKRATSWLNDES